MCILLSNYDSYRRLVNYASHFVSLFGYINIWDPDVTYIYVYIYTHIQVEYVWLYSGIILGIFKLSAAGRQQLLTCLF